MLAEQMFSISKRKKLKNNEGYKKSSMFFCLSISQLGFKELGSSFFLLPHKIHEEANYMSKLVTCFVLRKVVLYLRNF